MKELFRYEMWKRYRSNRLPLAVVLIFEFILIPLTLILCRCRCEVAAAVTSCLFLAAIAIVPVVDYLDSVRRFVYDISGSQSPLELSLARPAWKKVLSKLLAAICSLLILLCVSTALFVAFAVIMDGPGFNLSIHFNNMAGGLLSVIGQILGSAILFISGLISLLAITYFCSTLAKSISHKNSIAAPIGIAVFIIYVIITAIVDQFSSQVPIIKFTVIRQPVNLTSLIFDAAFFALAFFGTSWLMEKRLES